MDLHFKKKREYKEIINKAINEIAEMKFVNIEEKEEKEEKLDALVFLKNQILRKAEKLEIK